MRALGATPVRRVPGGARTTGELELAYRLCLESRLASRVLLNLIEDAECPDADALYQSVVAFPWEDHIPPGATLAVDFLGTSETLRNTQFAAQRVKDAVADRLRNLRGQRPTVDRRNPDLRLNARLHGARLGVAVDLSGAALHRRGYRSAAGRAPLKENLAAAILLRARWPELTAQGAALVDLMCGSATLAIEAALMASGRAPGLLQERWGFQGWSGHRPELWDRLHAQALERARDGTPVAPLRAFDQDPAVLETARANARRAEVGEVIEFERRDVLADPPPAPGESGLVVVNPPYGERLAVDSDPEGWYARLGETLRRGFPGWRAAVYTGRPALLPALGLRSERVYRLHNGALPGRLGVYRLRESAAAPEAPPDPAASPGAEMLANRLRKNLRSLGRWARREGIGCYRLYDADLPEYALAVDLYSSDALWAHVQEYAPPAQIAPRKALAHRREALAVIPRVLEIPPERVIFKMRRRRREGEQYQGAEKPTDRYLEVAEHGSRLWVNLTDRLDTGLFLDHRPVRGWIKEQARGRRFLNLFGYTGAATVQAAAGGAADTVTVDRSGHYLRWARRNLELNGFTPGDHRLIKADCQAWLAEQAQRPRPPAFDLILLDPPSLSRGGSQPELDLQRDHPDLIRAAAALLAPAGLLYFSTNLRRFRLDAALQGLELRDVTRASIPRDFARRPDIHHCWEIRWQRDDGLATDEHG